MKNGLLNVTTGLAGSPSRKTGLLRQEVEPGGDPCVPLTTRTIIFAGSYYEFLHKDHREPTKIKVLVAEGSKEKHWRQSPADFFTHPVTVHTLTTAKASSGL